MRAIVGAGIPVMGHIGLTPQSATMLGGFKTQGRTADAAASSSTMRWRSRRPAASRSCSRRCRPRSRREITAALLRIPTIGIGAGPACDGQVLVYHDLLGLTEGHLPRFVKRYANLSREIRDALEAYVAEVRTGAFPGPEHSYAMPGEELAGFDATVSTPGG